MVIIILHVQVFILVLIVGVNIVSAVWAAKVQIIFTVSKLLGIAIIVCYGMVRLMQGTKI